MQGLELKSGKEDQTQKPAWNFSGRLTGQTQVVELLSDSESISSTMSEQLPAYEQSAQAIHINRDGFQALATTACEFEFLVSIARLLLRAYSLSRRWTHRH